MTHLTRRHGCSFRRRALLAQLVVIVALLLLGTANADLTEEDKRKRRLKRELQREAILKERPKKGDGIRKTASEKQRWKEERKAFRENFRSLSDSQKEQARAERKAQAKKDSPNNFSRKSDSEKQRWKLDRKAFREQFKNLSDSEKKAFRERRKAESQRLRDRRRAVLKEDEGPEL